MDRDQAPAYLANFLECPSHQSALAMVILPLVLLISIVGCGDSASSRNAAQEIIDQATRSETAVTDLPAPERAAVLLEQIIEAEYQKWQRAPGYEERQPTQAPHGTEVDIYVNAELAVAIGSTGRSEWPVGSIVVKDGWDGNTLTLIAAMSKDSDGWFYMETNADLKPVFFGVNAGGCATSACHGKSGSDAILAFDLP